jgi:hypothetical protein
MAIVNDRHNSTKPVQVDPKTGKPLPGSSGRDSPIPQGLDSEKEGFFYSFFAAKNKKKMAAMEAPPPKLMASGTLSERENLEVEVISEWPSMEVTSLFPLPC